MITSPPKYIIELDGICYRLNGKTLEQIPNLSNITDDCFLISDLGLSSSRTMIVDSDIRYSELMVRKKLMESGEYDEPVTVITHWKKTKGRNSTFIFFTSLPTRILSQYQNNLASQDNCVLLFPLYSVLYSVIQKNQSKKPVAVLFQHNRFGDLLIGSSKEIFYANRCVSFDNSEEQIKTLWETIERDIKTAEADNGIKIEKLILVNWLDSSKRPMPDENILFEYSSLPKEVIHFCNKPLELSFFNAVRMESIRNSISKPMDKAAYLTKRITPLANILCILLLLFFTGACLFFANRTQQIDKTIMQTRREIVEIQKQIPTLSAAIGYQDTLSFVKKLSIYRETPSFQFVLNDLSSEWFAEMKLETLKVNYTSDSIQLELFGKISASFNSAYKGYQNFLHALKKRGYHLTENRFDTEIQDSRFFIKLSRAIP